MVFLKVFTLILSIYQHDWSLDPTELVRQRKNRCITLNASFCLKEQNLLFII